MRMPNAISVAAVVGALILALPMRAASALTLPSTSLEQHVASTQVIDVYFRGGYRGRGFRGGYRRGYAFRGGYGYHRFGYGGAALVGGLAVGAAVVGPHCWINSNGYRVCN